MNDSIRCILERISNEESLQIDTSVCGGYFGTRTKDDMLQKLSKLKTEHRIITAIFVGISVVSFWRGAWGLMDLYLFPRNLTISYVFSLFLGLAVLSITHYIVKELM